MNPALFGDLRDVASAAGRAVNPHYLADEAAQLAALCGRADCGAAMRSDIARTAERLVRAVRRDRRSRSGLDGLLHEYDLSSAEGVALMCLAEALLRIPDAATADALILDRLAAGAWAEHLDGGDSLFVNASTWALMLTGGILQPEAEAVRSPVGFLRQLAARIGEPVARAALRQAMRVIAAQFVAGRDIDQAVAQATEPGSSRYRYSFDMLGEAALTWHDAERCWSAYHAAVERLATSWPAGREPASISVKLSGLHPRLELAQREAVMKDLPPRLAELARAARARGVALTLDAEESEVLELQLAVFEATLRDPALAGWDGFGLAVQAYQRRAMTVLDWLAQLAADNRRRIPVRLVKGAYWDSEIKRAQEAGLASYPVFTRKVHTDVSYLACARRLLGASGRLEPQFATHNAHTVAWVVHVAGPRARYEFQRLHGMGEALYDEVLVTLGVPCRVYAPVGRHEDLLPYLVRRLLENGANSSFVNRIVQDEVPVAEVIADPVLQARDAGFAPGPALPEPPALYGASRRNSTGLNLADSLVVEALGRELAAFAERSYLARPVVDGVGLPGVADGARDGPAGNPAPGRVEFATVAQVADAVAGAVAAWPAWEAAGVGVRADVLRRAADLVEQARAEFVALLVREAGRAIPDALDEVRETVDFLRYYAAEAEALMGSPRLLPGPTGERNELRLRARGVFACISPWNFPLAITAGQIAAALVAGNAVVAKPAEQASLVAARLVAFLRQAGVPAGVLQFLPGNGVTIGAALVADPRLGGVAFTGSTAVARSIGQALAGHAGPGSVLVAETGGVNVLVADSSALPEQLARDAVRSAFNSAGQRCSALRVLAVQEEIAPRVIELIAGRMATLRIGAPWELATDVGPVIDATALAALEDYRERLRREHRILGECRPPEGAGSGQFFPPVLCEIEAISMIKEEIFGPILHLCRFSGSAWPALFAEINASGYGLTSGLHSRIGRRAREFADRVLAGNVYVNRNMVGAVVGVQPFGGRGLSGTGPKAGGPNYLARFTTEQTVSVNTAAIGGNAQLLGLKSGD